MKRRNATSVVPSQMQQDPRWSLAERIISSQCFGSSARLRSFLHYVADCTLRGAPEDATEQQIGIHVFGRRAGYNSSEDSIVRTQARLLRQKLTEYFAGEGAQEELVLEIPKGHYLPVFHPRPPVGEVLHLHKVSPGTAATSEGAGERQLSSPVRWWKLFGVAVVAIGIFGAGWWTWSGETARRSDIERFWGPFLADNSSLVIYSNALFTGDSKTGLHYAPPQASQGQPRPEDFVDTYTGIGEVASVYELARLFDSLHASFTLKRSLLVTWDEAKLRNLIFIGSIAENPSLRDITSTTDFTLMVGNGYSGIVNHHPKPGEPALYSRPEHPLTKDYAILALLPGVEPGKHMLVFSGLMTMGTQAAVEFACHRDTLAELLKPAKTPKGQVRPFEAVIETTIGGGVPLQSRLVTIHVH
jgi:hypothetical protein